MASLSSLNTFGNTTLSFTDNRPRDVKFSFPVARDIDVTILNNTFTALRKIDIIDIIQPNQAQVEYHIDVSAVSGTTVTWSTIPSGCSVTEVSGVYIMSGIDSVSDWDTVAAPTITVPSSFDGSFIYTSSIKYQTDNGQQSMSWDVGNYIPVSQLSCAFTSSVDNDVFKGTFINPVSSFDATATLSEAGMSGTSTFDFSASETATITGNPTVIYEDDDGTSDWTVTITGSPNKDSISSLSSSGTGGTSTYTAATKTLTLVGTLTEVNTHLNSISFVSTSTKQDFELVYTGESTAQSSGSYVRNQTMNCLNLDYLGPLRGSPTYVTNVASVIGTSLPEISDPDYTGIGSYTYTITPNNPSQVSNITDTGLLQFWEHNVAVSNVSRAIGSVGGVDSTGTYLFTHAPRDTKGLNQHQKDVNGNWYEIFRYAATDTQDPFGRYMQIGDDSTMAVLTGSAGDSNNIQAGNQNLYVVFLFRWDAAFGHVKTARKFQMPSGDSGTNYVWGQHYAMDGDGTKVAINYGPDTGTKQIYIYEETSTDTWTLEKTLGYGIGAGNASDYNAFSISPDGNWLARWDHTSGGPELEIIDISDLDAVSLPTTEVSLPGNISDYSSGCLKWNANNHLFVGAPNYNTEDGRIMSYNTSGTLLDTLDNPSPSTASRFGDWGNNDYKLNNEIKFNNAGTYFTSRGFAIDVDSSGNMTHDTDVPHIDVNLVTDQSSSADAKKFFTFTIDQSNDLSEYYLDNNPQGYSNNEFVLTGTKTQINDNLDSIELTSASGEAGNIRLTVDLTTPESNTEDKDITVTNQGS